jgi:outer membrane protein assembly factor BamE (lipoprotein component of BamABCDE complex)
MSRFSTAILVVALLAGSSTSFAADEPNTLTHGMVQMTLRVGQTTQMDVLNAFGAPNITTLDGDGREVWVYDRHATVTADSSSGFSIGMLIGGGGDGVGGAGGLGFGKKKSKSSESTRTMTLIIKFGPDKRVVDFKSRSSSF